MYIPLLTFKQAFVIILLTLLTGCLVTKDGEVYINSTPRDYTEQVASPIYGDTTSAALENMGLSEEEILLNIAFDNHLYSMRQQEFVYPRFGGGAYVIRYYEGNVIYAAIIAPDNTTQEDIVFFKEKWYYNQNKHREEIGPKQATIFVETILNDVASQENEINSEDGGS